MTAPARRGRDELELELDCLGSLGVDELELEFPNWREKLELEPEAELPEDEP